ncbi:MAG: outer membrane protein assembly factor BamD [Chitinivibrionales bacterium]|nr:outer membrane protein assembly factor BamD [Chitinivibrionales bacterium]
MHGENRYSGMKISYYTKISIISAVFAAMLVFVPWNPVEAKRRKEKRSYDCSEKFQRVKKRFEKERFTYVKNNCNEIRMNCSGHEIMDSATYYLARAQMLTKNPAEAKIEFQQIVRDYPQSPFAEEARFRIGHCSLLESKSYERDQSMTREAIRELRDFVMMNPESLFADSAKTYLRRAVEKLARKEFNNARFYEKIDEYEAAVVYYQVLIEEFPDSKYVPRAKLNMAEDLMQVNRENEAKAILKELLDSSVSSEIRSRAKTLKERLEKSG